MYKETFFFNFRGILTSDKIAKNEKLQKTGFLILPLAESNSSRLGIFMTIHGQNFSLIKLLLNKGHFSLIKLLFKKGHSEIGLGLVTHK